MADPERRRRRLRHSPTGGPDGTDESTSPQARSAATAEVHDPTPEPGRPRRLPSGTGAGGGPSDGGGADDRDSERGLRGLVGSGASQVSVSAALRARDASRPTDADLAEAEQRVVVIRRNWVPREELPRNGQ
jgi:hypothetical protein